jgi:hypothetical protein
LDARFSALQSNVWDALQLLGYKPIIPQTDKTNIFWAYEEMEGRKINTIKNSTQNKIKDFKKHFFSNTKIPL